MNAPSKHPSASSSAHRNPEYIKKKKEKTKEKEEEKEEKKKTAQVSRLSHDLQRMRIEESRFSRTQPEPYMHNGQPLEIFGLPPSLDNPDVRFLTLRDPNTQQPWIILRFWPMSSTWRDAMFGWFIDVLDTERRMIPPPSDLTVTQDGPLTGGWTEIRTLEHSARNWMKMTSPDEKYFVPEGVRLLLYKAWNLIGEIKVPLHTQRLDPITSQRINVLQYNA
ncbi:hypothetical protein BDP27DRAFT_1420470 [Rhodocollybia butyracea]|uniref:Uncharacterized protein n=1 Tax=Rhodocollybia butyracea TaxID=206335 RepID=A0A9P5PQ10_9AGAR|nr:hypothetical protein BDP27DRAFT_1420470 [Rhodocollybia butyracea]